MKKKKFTDYELMHSQGIITLENIPDKLKDRKLIHGDLGIQIQNGKVWLCIDGIAFLRFSPINRMLEKIKGN